MLTPWATTIAELKAMARKEGYEPEDLKGRMINRKASYFRWTLFRHLHAKGWSLPKIADLFDVDYSTAQYGVCSEEARNIRRKRNARRHQIRKQDLSRLEGTPEVGSDGFALFAKRRRKAEARLRAKRRAERALLHGSRSGGHAGLR